MARARHKRRGDGKPAVLAQPQDLQELAKQVQQDGGQVLTMYQEPVSGAWQLFALMPLEKVKPTPYQRDLSASHVERLKEVIEAVGRFLDPVIAIRAPNGEYWTPNGNHRRAALEALGSKTIPVILLPDPNVAFQILALNTEKAHNLKEKSLEVIRMYRGLLEKGTMGDHEGLKEADFAFQFEEAHFATLGLLYEKSGRFSGGAYTSLLKKVDHFLDLPLRDAYAEREKRAAKLEEADGLVSELVQQLRERGIQHPFVKNFVVARCNPLARQRKAELSYEEALEKLLSSLKKFDIASVRPEDIARAAVAGE